MDAAAIEWNGVERNVVAEDFKLCARRRIAPADARKDGGVEHHTSMNCRDLTFAERIPARTAQRARHDIIARDVIARRVACLERSYASTGVGDDHFAVFDYDARYALRSARRSPVAESSTR